MHVKKHIQGLGALARVTKLGYGEMARGSNITAGLGIWFCINVSVKSSIDAGPSHIPVLVSVASEAWEAVSAS
jgi:hypothetical protein